MGCGAAKSAGTSVVERMDGSNEPTNPGGPIDELMSVTDTGGSAMAETKAGGESLIRLHPPKKPQWLEEDIPSSMARGPRDRLTMSSGIHNPRSSIQDVPEENEDVEEGSPATKVES